ncbi:uncharacterized protein BDZ99DRAFT_230316 [Mytilinidion resinicola]|uniref:Uncharacterized protein n=1 Tax=Mytilinidion resinicola TaxID=574789 RepID=A0A6A6YYK8_9PEZI|nr:uncharacterized protein BDZ99DRAFT_230316 [Mytilinidion resinicola]KAF2814026.1 hypothetical protein BDZ99DRAFT_230316 [Mytilinidion resinicola]
METHIRSITRADPNNPRGPPRTYALVSHNDVPPRVGVDLCICCWKPGPENFYWCPRKCMWCQDKINHKGFACPLYIKNSKWWQRKIGHEPKGFAETVGSQLSEQGLTSFTKSNETKRQHAFEEADLHAKRMRAGPGVPPAAPFVDRQEGSLAGYQLYTPSGYPFGFAENGTPYYGPPPGLQPSS